MQQQTYTDSLGRTFELREREVFSPHFHPRTTFIQEWHQVSTATAVASPPAEESVPAAAVGVVDEPAVQDFTEADLHEMLGSAIEIPPGVEKREDRHRAALVQLLEDMLRFVDCYDVLSESQVQAMREILETFERRTRLGDLS